jgi:hypothetical protein
VTSHMLTSPGDSREPSCLLEWLSTSVGFDARCAGSLERAGYRAGSRGFPGEELCLSLLTADVPDVKVGLGSSSGEAGLAGNG